ncbi:14283_t:CDS:2 [Dentiscutata erythropus]|uniref:14283_t:CDS:1 n=1 Tax=Dentiscutata erythropus TaxID=1348616 RepID=A0A9N8ZCM0_9GLOM|nr:14283_t:CDS:2 [Dentiscutata erythropus]
MEVLNDVGNGQVHHYLIKNTFGFDYDQDIICCGGFSYHEKQLKFSSVWLNERNQKGWESDGSKYLSGPEQILVEYCFEEYKKFGSHHIFKIPNYIEKQLINSELRMWSYPTNVGLI